MPVEIKELVIQARMRDEQSSSGADNAQSENGQEATAPATELTDEMLRAIEEAVRKAMADYRVR